MRLAYTYMAQPIWIFLEILRQDSRVRSMLPFVKWGKTLRIQHGKSDKPGVYAQILVAYMIAQVQERDHDWIALVADQLGELENDI
jgi:hypothetical protein